MKNSTLFQASSDLYENSDIGMYYCGKRIQTPNHTYGPEIRNYYLFMLVNEGEASFFHKSGIIKLKAHDMLVMCPSEKIHYVANTLWSNQWIGLYGQAVDNYMKVLSVNGDNPIIHIEQYRELKILLDELYNISKERFEHTRYYQISLIYRFFSLLSQSTNKKTSTDIVDSAKKIMDYNFDKDITIAQIAATLYTNPAYLTRLFTERYRISPKEYLIEKRMTLAKKLLRESNSNIMEISNSVGYVDSLYFSRIFKKKEGISPLNYRKNHK